MKRTFSPKVTLGLNIMCALGALFFLYTAFFGVRPPMMQRGVLIALSLVLVFIYRPPFKQDRKGFLILDICLALASVATMAYVMYWEQVMIRSGFVMPEWDVLVGTIIIVLVLEATRRALGWILSVIGLLFLLYGFFAHLVPGVLQTTRFDPAIIVQFVAVSPQGIIGPVAHVAATIVIMFMLFGSFIAYGGADKFFVDLPLALFGRTRGGPAKVAVVGSGLLGMINGSPAANVATTGTFTIPLMKRLGYQPHQAGAIEACASTGGLIMPPVMGAAAFLIADNLGIPFWDVCIAAFIPAVLYYASIFVQSDLQAIKLGIKGLPREELPSAIKTMAQYGYLLIPFGVLIYWLAILQGSPLKAALWAIIGVVLFSFVRKSTRMGPRKIFNALNDGIRIMADIMTVICTAGIIIGILSMTGLGVHLSSFIVAISGGHLIIVLVLCMILCLLLGMGMTATAIYILVALIVAPALTKSGVPAIAAHLFVFYFGCLCCITPPVGSAILVATPISGGKFWTLGWQAVRLGLILFIVPYFFVYNPALIAQGAVVDIVQSAVTAVIGVTTLSFALEGQHFWGKINITSRVLFGASTVLLLMPGLQTDLIAIPVILAGFLLGKWMRF